jgi:ring-1,2-phenylacetyl-CoA epoxidase subunit PaaB
VEVFEVFRQEEAGGAFVHVGSVQAPDMELAQQYARDIFSRREDAVRLWVVPRSCVHEVTDLDLLRPQLDRKYRLGRGYRVTVEKRKRIKARVQTLIGAETNDSPSPLVGEGAGG